MSIVIPTVTAFENKDFVYQFDLVTKFANRIHIDLMDGIFAPTKSPNIEDIDFIDRYKGIIDFHLMIENPKDSLERIMLIKPSLVIVHAESSIDVPHFASMLRQNNIRTGLALLPETKVSYITYCLAHIQHVLVFGGHLGYHGGTADLSQLDKVRELRINNPHLEIGWDGGAGESNISKISDAGVDVINVGSSIHQSTNPEEKYHLLSSLC